MKSIVNNKKNKVQLIIIFVLIALLGLVILYMCIFHNDGFGMTAINNDVLFEFNAKTVDSNQNESYDDLLLSGIIFADSISYDQDYISFNFTFDECEEIYSFTDYQIYWNIAAYNVKTEELLPIDLFSYNDVCVAFVEIGDISPANVRIVFSGASNSKEDYVLDDYLSKQVCSKDSLIAKVKLFN